MNCEKSQTKKTTPKAKAENRLCDFWINYPKIAKLDKKKECVRKLLPVLYLKQVFFLFKP